MKLSVSALALLTSLTPALATDLSLQSPSLKDTPQAGTARPWTGFYVSGGVGGHFVNHALSSAALAASLDGGAQGVMGTAGGGYDVKLGKFVFGVFGDYDFSNASTTVTFGKAFGPVDLRKASGSVDLDHMWTVGGRAGVLLSPETLAYAIAGFSQANFAAGGGDRDFSGYTVGGGLETQLGMGFSLKGEYRYTSLDTETVTVTARTPIAVDTDVNSVRAVVSYKINPFN